MDGIEVKKRATTTKYLPHDIIENILCRLPVKSLLRFEAVCKQWKATISDREFATTHLRLSKKSSCLLSLRKGHLDGSKRADLVDLRNHEFRLVSTVDDPLITSHTSILCHCDGLYVIDCRNKGYALWNPSRRSYKILDRYSFGSRRTSFSFFCGICYDPSVKDYKIVMGDASHYAVYYCRSNSWSDLKEKKRELILFTNAITSHGSIYWVCRCLKSSNWDLIVYFDGKDEKLKILRELDSKCFDITRGHSIPAVDNDVGLYTYKHYHDGGSVLIVKKGVGEDELMESKVVVPPVDDGVCLWPICCSGDDKIVFGDGLQYLHFDIATRSFSTILDNSNYEDTNVFPYGYSRIGYLFPYVENLFWH